MANGNGVTLDFSKAQPLTLDFSKAQPIQQQTGGGQSGSDIGSFQDMMNRLDLARRGGKQLPGESVTDALSRVNQSRTLQNMTSAMSGQPMQNPEDQPSFEAGRKSGMKAAAETTGMVLGGEAVPAMRGIIGTVARMLGVGGGAAVGNVAGQLGTTGTVDPNETLKTGGTAALFQGGMEGLSAALPALRGYLGKLMYQPSGELTPLARAVVHPTELPEIALRKVIPEPPSYPGGQLPSVEEFYANKAVEIMRRGKEQAALDKAVGKIPDWQTPTHESFELGSPENPGLMSKVPLKLTAAQQEALRGTPTSLSDTPKPSPFAGAPRNPKGQIVSPESIPPDVKVTYQSVPEKPLLNMVMSGDRLAIMEWQRRGLALPENVGYMVEEAGTKGWRNYRK